MKLKPHHLRSTGRLALVLAVGCITANGANYTADFTLEGRHFSTVGVQAYFSLNPGQQSVLRGDDDGEEVVVTITVLNETKDITLAAGERVRRIATRVIEEREMVDGELADLSRGYYARCIETSDIYFFGEDVDCYEDGQLVGHQGSWEAGIDGARPGIVMPGTFMSGARYVQATAPGDAVSRAENMDMGLTVETASGTFENCVRIQEFDPVEPDDEPGEGPSIKIYAPCIGLIDDEGVRLEELNLGVADHLRGDLTFRPFSDHPYFPLLPGQQSVYDGFEDGGELVTTLTVLDETKDVFVETETGTKTIRTRVVEEREFVDGQLDESARKFYAQCRETGDVYFFGEEVTFYQTGKDPEHFEAWLAGVDGAQPGLVMPANFTVGARYFPEAVPEEAVSQAVNSAMGITMTVPAGTFSECVQVKETDQLEPDEEQDLKTYAPGVGLISEGEELKLKVFSQPGVTDGNPVLSIEESILLTWSMTAAPASVQSSSDMQIWTNVPYEPVNLNGKNTISLPRDKAHKYFRLLSPK